MKVKSEKRRENTVVTVSVCFSGQCVTNQTELASQALALVKLALEMFLWLFAYYRITSCKYPGE